MGLYSIILIGVFVVNLGTAIFVLVKNPKVEVNRTFFGLGLSIALWGLGALILSLVPDKEAAFDSLVILNLGQVFIFSTFFHFVLTITSDHTRFHRRLSYAAYLFSLILLAIDRFFHLINKDVVYVFDTYYPVGGPGAHLFNLLLLFFLSYGTYLLYRRHRSTPSFIERNQLRYVFLGMGIAILGSLSNILLVFGVRVYPIAHITVLVFNLTVAYSIAKYHLMDIKVVIKKGIVYSLLTAFVTGIWLFNIFFLGGLFQTLFGYKTPLSTLLVLAIIIFSLEAVRERLQYFVDKRLFRERYDQRELLKKVSKTITATIDKDTFLPEILKIITDTLHPRSVGVMLRNEKGGYETEATSGAKEKDTPLRLEEATISWLKGKKGNLLKAELEREASGFNQSRNKILADLNRLGADLVVPLLFEGELLGILTLGEKLSENPYDYDDLMFLSALSGEIAIAINNARVYSDLKERTSELERANKAKSEFLSLVSHELRTPLTTIISYLYMLKTKRLGELNERQMDGLKVMEKKADHLKRLIEDLLALSRTEYSQEVGLAIIKPIKIGEVLNEVVASLSPLAEEKGIELSVLTPQDLSSILGDQRIAQVFINLIENAIKFTPRGGGILVKVKDMGDHLECSVKDTGIGIEQSEQERIFERFYQIDSSDTREYPGTGLGLAIVKEIIEAWKGKIWVISEKGKGSEFIFTVPKVLTMPEEIGVIEYGPGGEKGRLNR